MLFLPRLLFKGLCEIFIKINKNYLPAVSCSLSFLPCVCLEDRRVLAHFSLVRWREEGHYISSRLPGEPRQGAHQTQGDGIEVCLVHFQSAPTTQGGTFVCFLQKASCHLEEQEDLPGSRKKAVELLF